MSKSKLAETLTRELTAQKPEILEGMSEHKEKAYLVEFELSEEPGEIVITLMMTDEEIAKSVIEAVSDVFPGKKISDIKSVDKYLAFKIS